MKEIAPLIFDWMSHIYSACIDKHENNPLENMAKLVHETETTLNILYRISYRYLPRYFGQNVKNYNESYLAHLSYFVNEEGTMGSFGPCFLST